MIDELMINELVKAIIPRLAAWQGDSVLYLEAEVIYSGIQTVNREFRRTENYV